MRLFDDIPNMLLYYFKVMVNFLYVYQSVSWLTSLLIEENYRDFSRSGWAVFLNWKKTFFGYSYTSLIYFLICIMSVSLLVGWLPYWGISPVPDEISIWNFLETFLDKLGTFLKIIGSLFPGGQFLRSLVLIYFKKAMFWQVLS